ncbi:TerD family protein [Nodularia spumigena]|jgi:tellurium resistance protein TerD|uniref:TerD family protein n=1 Tax=Nodularia spumigena UHCC 0060 TaxID=3110300 RepID=A0ABU5UQQ1_NODSP|nr:TerD family protein [Nodularia spumigena]MEA5525535.1 TerD family protein [Nodularia spumigena UHCC 0143]MEA5556526.1 TerD family protein [Nodularia spumigena CH309]MEA5608600.1 TerD family protein [Nodularia spumigena UHCC 0060]MEA5612025.1 TerD family protein [Nodularia spumigena UHCC 0040]
MAISLQKGQRISLSKEAPTLTKLMCGLGWDVAKRSGGGFFSNFGGGHQYDLDASVICLDANGKVTGQDNIIYFGNLQHSSGAITHTGDNLTGAGDGDDEVIIVDLPRIPAQIAKLVFVINIYECLSRKQDFSQIENAFVRLVNADNNKELARYNLSGKDYQGMTGMILAEVYRHKNEWKMVAVGNGTNVNGLGELIKSYC